MDVCDGLHLLTGSMARLVSGRPSDLVPSVAWLSRAFEYRGLMLSSE